jgi:hypothetical protein
MAYSRTSSSPVFPARADWTIGICGSGVEITRSWFILKRDPGVLLETLFTLLAECPDQHPHESIAE